MQRIHGNVRCVVVELIIFNPNRAIMKIYLGFLAASCFSLCSYGQNWKTIESTDQYSLSVAEVEYDSASDGIHHQRIVFKYENYSNTPLELSFNREVQYGEIATTQEQTFKVSIPAKAVVEYGDATKYDKTYYIFKKDYKGTIKKELKDFKITNLSVQ
jgi:hypothetical protein